MYETLQWRRETGWRQRQSVRYFEANAVEASRKVSVLLTVIGAKAYDTLRSLLPPILPRDKSFPELLAILKQHFDPKPLVIGEHFHFYKRSQKPTETVAEFLADLQKLSIRCEFGTFLDQALWDRFVCGVRNETTQKKLLTEDRLSVARALEIAQSIEAADKNSRELKGHASVTLPDSLNFAGANKAKPCYHCGRGHDAKTYKFREAECNPTDRSLCHSRRRKVLLNYGPFTCVQPNSA